LQEFGICDVISCDVITGVCLSVVMQ